MKIICAGFPKTGSKSCSTALRQLGYNVADYKETAEFLRSVSFGMYKYDSTKMKIYCSRLCNYDFQK